MVYMPNMVDISSVLITLVEQFSFVFMIYLVILI